MSTILSKHRTHALAMSHGERIAHSVRETPNSHTPTAVKLARMFGNHRSLRDTIYMARMGYGGY